MQILLDAGADTELCTKDGMSPLFLAASAGQLGTLRLLVEGGADKNRPGPSRDPSPPVVSAAVFGHVEVVKYLLTAGASSTSMKVKILNLSNSKPPIWVRSQPM